MRFHAFYAEFDEDGKKKQKDHKRYNEDNNHNDNWRRDCMTDGLTDKTLVVNPLLWRTDVNV